MPDTTSPGFRTPRPNTAVSISYPPGVGAHAEDRYRFVHHFGISAAEAVRTVLTELQLRPADVRAREMGGDRGEPPEVSILGRNPYRPVRPDDPNVCELAIIYAGVTKAAVIEALAALHAQRFDPRPVGVAA